jgi:hypothetical protein
MTENTESNVPALEDTIYALLVTNMRIYDALMAIVAAENPTLAENILDMHAAGHMVGPSINYDGLHIYDEQARPTGDEQADEESE